MSKMQTSTKYILAGVAAVAAYLLFIRKPAAALPVAGGAKPPVTSPPGNIDLVIPALSNQKLNQPVKLGQTLTLHLPSSVIVHYSDGSTAGPGGSWGNMVSDPTKSDDQLTWVFKVVSLDNKSVGGADSIIVSDINGNGVTIVLVPS